ncbi:MAG: hypothetical protein WAV18_05970 [Roseiarcus sp.]
MSQSFENGKWRPILAGIAPKAEQARQSLISMAFSSMAGLVARLVPAIYGVRLARGSMGITATLYLTTKGDPLYAAALSIKGLNKVSP